MTASQVVIPDKMERIEESQNGMRGFFVAPLLRMTVGERLQTNENRHSTIGISTHKGKSKSAV